MKIRKLESGGFVLTGVGQGKLAALRQAVTDADPSAPDLQRRLFPDVISVEEAEPGGDDATLETIRNDWDELVKPELETLFDEGLREFRNDLDQAQIEDGAPGETGEGSRVISYRIEAPAGHAMSWLRALNQARLAINERFPLPEDDEPSSIQRLFEAGAFAEFLRARFFAVVQEWLVANYLEDS